jgi:hypothetical protein
VLITSHLAQRLNQPGSGSSLYGTSTAARRAWRVSRTASCERDGATITNAVPAPGQLGRHALDGTS